MSRKWFEVMISRILLLLAKQASITCILILYIFSQREPSYLHVRVAVGQICAPGVLLLLSRLGSRLAFYNFWLESLLCGSLREINSAGFSAASWSCCVSGWSTQVTMFNTSSHSQNELLELYNGLEFRSTKQLSVGTLGVKILRTWFGAASVLQITTWSI
jgi:hypothetical protein